MKIIAITTPKVTDEDAYIIKGLLDKGIDTIHLRKPESGIDECRKLLAELTAEQRAKIVVHDYPELYFEFSLKGIHLNRNITALPDGYNGKWVIDSTENALGEQIYYFELYANNGEKLLSSEEYTSYIGAVNGIETHKKNIDNNNFRISLTKRGDYIFKLLNGNGQLLCLGEHYKTKRLCQNAVESVKRFAAVSPVLINAKDN